jgi:hemerythrin-like domain-containing protein
MKRNENIVPLSRDHHTGLLCCWKIRQGLARKVEMERIKKYVQWFWQNHLEQHFLEEESILFNVISHQLCDEAIEQHRQIKKLICDICTNHPACTSFYRIADLLDQHIRFEERTLFPMLETEIRPALMDNIGDKLRALHQHPTLDDYPDEFWKD